MAQTTHDGVAARPVGDENPGREPAPRAVTGLARLLAWSPAVVALVLLAYGVHAGLPAGHAVRALAVVLITQVLPGALVWRTVRPRRGWLVEDLAMGFAIGSVLAIGVQVVAGLTGRHWIGYSPLLVAVVLLAVPATRARVMGARTEPLPWWVPPAMSAACLVSVPQLRGYFHLVPLTWSSGARATHVDAYLHLALSAQLAERGPTTFPWVQSEQLGYHWLSHAWIAQVSVTSGVGLDEVLFRFMPVLMPVVVVLSVATAAIRLSGRPWAGPVAAVVAMVGGDLYVFGRYSSAPPLTPLSPSLALGAPMVLGTIVVLALRWDRTLLRGGILLLPVLAIGAAGSKGSTLPIVVAGVGLAFVAMLLVDRSRVRAVAIDLGIVLACLAFAYVFIFRLSGAGLHLNLSDAAAQTPGAGWIGGPPTVAFSAFVIVLAVVAAGSRGLGMLVLPFAKDGYRQPLTWLLIGAGIAGTVAVGIFAHPGRSQYYFARTADPILALGGTLGLVALTGMLQRREFVRAGIAGVVAGPLAVLVPGALLGPQTLGHVRHAVGMVLIGLAVLALAAVAAVLVTRRPGARVVAPAALAVIVAVIAGGMTIEWHALTAPPPPPAEPVALTRPLAVSRDQIDAARWIRDHSDRHDLVMTNRHCVSPAEPRHCDSRRWNVSAFSERQTLVEGWTATGMSAKLGPEGRDSITVDYWHPELLALNDGFIAAPTAAAAQELTAKGVKWVFVDHTRPYAATLEPYAIKRYSNRGVDVYEFP